MIRPACVILAGLLLPGSLDEPAKYEPTDRYEARQVEGWTVLVNKKFLAEEPELADRALTLLRFQLYQVARRLPEKAVGSLRRSQEKYSRLACQTFKDNDSRRIR